MISMQARIMRFMLRNRHLMKGKLKPQVITKETSIEALRKDTDETAERMVKLPEGVTFLQEEGTPVYAEWAVPDGAPSDKMVLYFHGGGFVMGNARSHRGIVAGFVKRLGVKALVFDYRLAPEHSAPAAAEDGAAMYRYVLQKGYLPQNIVVAGDSAGGGVALSTLLMLKDKGVPLPAAYAGFSPCTDITCAGESHVTRLKQDPCTPKGANETYLGYYAGKGDPKHPYASPLFGELSGLPPMMIQVGDYETLRDDSVRFINKAVEAGVEAHLHVWDGLFHCFPLLAPMFPEATQALDETCRFIHRFV